MRWNGTALVVGVIGVALSAPVYGQQADVPPAYSDLFTGAFYGIGVQTGPAFVGNDEVDGSFGWAISAEARVSLLLHLLDFQLDFTHASLWGDLSSGSFSLASESVAASLGLHPLFAAVLFGEGLGYVLSSVCVQWGLSAEWSRFDLEGQKFSDAWELGQHLGVGLDVPLDLVNDGEAFWLGFQYRHHSVPTSFAPISTASGDISQHLFLLRLSYRINGQPW